MISFPGEDYHSLATIRRTGGYRPDDTFEERFGLTLAAARLARRLGLSLLTTHIGFIPDPSDASAFALMRDRLRRVADALADLDLTLCFETGQETADTLAAFLTALDRPNVGVNFDPANLLLYGKGNPVDAAIRLSPWIRHVHAKDAQRLLPAGPDAWHAAETPLGFGNARVAEVLWALRQTGYRGPLAIERESGHPKDLAIAIAFLKETLRRWPP